MKTATLSEIVGERARVLRCQVDEKAFGDHQRVLRARVEVLEELLPGSAIAEIGWNSLQPAIGLVRAEDFFLVGKQWRKIDLHPLQRGREVHPIRSGVKAGRQIDDRIRAARDGLADEVIEQKRADHPVS